MGRVCRIVVMHSQSVVTDDAQTEGSVTISQLEQGFDDAEQVDHTVLLVADQTFNGEGISVMTGRNPEEVIDDGTVQARFRVRAMRSISSPSRMGRLCAWG